MSSSTPDIAALARRQLLARRLDPALSEAVALPNGTPADPWLLLHCGRCLCRLRSDFESAGVFVDAALLAFEQRGDGEGRLWALVEWLVLSYHAAEFARGLAALEALDMAGLTPYLRSELLFGRFLCLIGLDASDRRQSFRALPL
jgi:hypothetical protein